MCITLVTELNLTKTFSPTLPPFVLSETEERDAFFLFSSFLQSKFGSEEAPLCMAASDSLPVGLRADRQRGPALEVRLIRCSARCPASIRRPFIESDLFFRWALEGTHSATMAIILPGSFACLKKTCHFLRTIFSRIPLKQ